MNLIILQECDELIGPRTLIVRRERVIKHVRDILRASAKDWLNVGRLNGNIGRAQIEALGDRSLTLRLEKLVTLAPKKVPLHVALAIPRPTVIGRVLQNLCAMGVTQITFFQSALSEKTYWSSPTIKEDKILNALILGLEQARDTCLPQVTLHQESGFLMKLPANTDTYVGEAGTPKAPLKDPASAQLRTLLIGPERGWTSKEVHLFASKNFQMLPLGYRQLKVENAAYGLIARYFL